MIKLSWIFIILIFIVVEVTGQPGNYYNSISTSSPTFISDLKTRIRFPYTKISYDLFDETNIANFASINNGNGTRSVFCVYSNYEHIYTGTFSWIPLSREHTYAHSWQPTSPSTGGDEYADQHHLFPTHQDNANGIRDNHPLGNVVNPSYTFLESKLGTDASGNIVYEPRNAHKGDAARALLYMVVRYDGIGGNAWTFDWLNNTRLPSLPEAPQSVTTLIEWHKQDPPDKWEVDRNNYIQSIQQNRNPFIDHPEWVNYINFNNLSTISPGYAAEPTNYVTNLSSTVSSNSVTVNWTDAIAGSQLPSGYLLLAYSKDNYFIPIDGSTYNDDSNLSDGRAAVNISYNSPDDYTFNNLSLNTTYYFTIYSYNGTGTQINYKIDGIVPTLQATTAGTTTLPNAWINEIHYDNNGTDVNEFVEVVIPNICSTPIDLAKFTVVLYNGSGGAVYNTTSLSSFTKGTVDSLHGFTLYSFLYSVDGLQNGAPDGIALGYDSNLIQFLSYEGIFTGVGGIANGVLSTDMGVLETSSTPIGSSLGLTGAGRKYSDFTWTTFPAAESRGAINGGQTLLAYTLNITALLEGLFNGTTMISDSVVLQIRNTASPYNLVDQAKVLLNSSGSATTNFYAVSDAISYYIVVKHRNSIETWSASGQSFNEGTLNFNFTTAASQAYGGNLKNINGKWCLFSGDVNQDGVVDLADLILIDNDAFNFATGYQLTDLTGDNVVDLGDLIICDNNAYNFIGTIYP